MSNPSPALPLQSQCKNRKKFTKYTDRQTHLASTNQGAVLEKDINNQTAAFTDGRPGYIDEAYSSAKVLYVTKPADQP